ncbi:hypothetical protein G3455_16930 [Shewanella baltica]|nr:hypothetical protein [Shewanella baltica]
MTGHYPLLSHDGGDTWVQAGVTGWNNASEPLNLLDNLWVMHKEGRFYYANIENGLGFSGYLTPVQMRNYTAKYIEFNPLTGAVSTCRVGATAQQKAVVSITGDITAARVEVMELLS